MLPSELAKYHFETTALQPFIQSATEMVQNSGFNPNFIYKVNYHVHGKWFDLKQLNSDNDKLAPTNEPTNVTDIICAKINNSEPQYYIVKNREYKPNGLNIPKTVITLNALHFMEEKYCWYIYNKNIIVVFAKISLIKLMFILMFFSKLKP